MIGGAGHARQRMRHRLAVDQQDACVAGFGDLRQVALDHRVALPVLRQRLEYDACVLVPRGQSKDRVTAHAVQRLADDAAMLGEEGLHAAHIARDQGRRAAIGEPGRIDLLVHVAQALRAIHDQHAFSLRAFQQIGRVDVLQVEWRVLAHQHGIDIGKRSHHGLPGAIPGLSVSDDLQRSQPGDRATVAQPEIGLFEAPGRAAAPGGRREHRDRLILGRLDSFERVDQHCQAGAVSHQYGSARLTGM